MGSREQRLSPLCSKCWPPLPNNVLIHATTDGDTLRQQGDSLVLHFGGRRRVLATPQYGGGLHEDVEYIFNHTMRLGKYYPRIDLSNYLEYMNDVANTLGLGDASCIGMLTAAYMEHVAVAVESHGPLTITAIVTAGVDHNGGRIGDPTTYFEALDNEFASTSALADTPIPKPGTINMMILINGNLLPHTMARAIVTCTEAKTAALQELCVGSVFSHGLATGSGTDEIAIVVQPEAPYRYNTVGKHSKVGEILGNVVRRAVKEALYNQTGMGPVRQYHILERWRRFGITPERVYAVYQARGGCLVGTDFERALVDWGCQSRVVVTASITAHLLDEWSWGLLTAQDVVAGLEAQGIYLDPATEGQELITAPRRYDGQPQMRFQPTEAAWTHWSESLVAWIADNLL